MTSAEGEERWLFLRSFFNLSWQSPLSLPEGTSRGHCVMSACKKPVRVTEQPLSTKGHLPAALARREPARGREEGSAEPSCGQPEVPPPSCRVLCCDWLPGPASPSNLPGGTSEQEVPTLCAQELPFCFSHHFMAGSCYCLDL